MTLQTPAPQGDLIPGRGFQADPQKINHDGQEVGEFAPRNFELEMLLEPDQFQHEGVSPRAADAVARGRFIEQVHPQVQRTRG